MREQVVLAGYDPISAGLLTVRECMQITYSKRLESLESWRQTRFVATMIVNRGKKRGKQVRPDKLLPLAGDKKVDVKVKKLGPDERKKVHEKAEQVMHKRLKEKGK